MLNIVKPINVTSDKSIIPRLKSIELNEGSDQGNYKGFSGKADASQMGRTNFQGQWWIGDRYFLLAMRFFSSNIYYPIKKYK